MTPVSTRLESVRTRFQRAVEDSLVVRTIRRLEATLTGWFRGSRIVRWFLAEPDPEVIVIDLRETYTVGPLLGVLDRVVAAGSRFGEQTGATRVVGRASDRVAAEPLRIVGIVLLALAVAGLAATVAMGGTPGSWLILFGVALLASRERRSAAALARTRVGRALRTAFEPPEPPTQEDR